MVNGLPVIAASKLALARLRAGRAAPVAAALAAVVATTAQRPAQAVRSMHRTKIIGCIKSERSSEVKLLRSGHT